MKYGFTRISSEPKPVKTNRNLFLDFIRTLEQNHTSLFFHWQLVFVAKIIDKIAGSQSIY